MKLQNLTVIFLIIIIPIILLQSAYISNGIKTINYQTIYDTGLVTATHDAVHAYELNTLNDEYSSSAQTKREILNASIKMFERSLCKTCNIPEFNLSAIENYIPAIVFGLYDGFYIYAPSVIPEYKIETIGDGPTAFQKSVPTGEYETKHNLKSYIYYSEQIGSDKNITIRYTLDNYVIITGPFGASNEYITKSGYLINPSTWSSVDVTNDADAKKYIDKATAFSNWFSGIVTSKGLPSYLSISATNDPEDPDSPFTQHKRDIIKTKIESTLNSVITAYANRTYGNKFKMPKISPENWEKVYSDVSVITFFQGKNIGLTEYNGYCVLNSNGTSEYVNPGLLYFTNNKTGYYHDIRCPEILKGTSPKVTGYNISRFQGRIFSSINEINKMINYYNDPSLYTIEYYWYYMESGKEVRYLHDSIEPVDDADKVNYLYTRVFVRDKSTNRYLTSMYTFPESTEVQGYQRFVKSDNSLTDSLLGTDDTYVPLACYFCINASITTTLNNNSKEYSKIYDYVTDGSTNSEVKKIYWTALARERENRPKLTAEQ